MNDDRAAGVLRAARLVVSSSLRERAFDGRPLSGGEALTEYLIADMGYLPIERSRVLLLDKQLRLLRDVTLSNGTIDEAPIFPREVFRAALLANASALILIHNHPSGEVLPSKADVAVTALIARLSKQMGIDLLDHLIITRSGAASFRALGLL